MSGRKWQYCVIGNIAKTHIDEEGSLRYGTSAFSGGTKVYLCSKRWDFSQDTIQVLGLCRGKKYQVHCVPTKLIEKVRCSRVYNPAVLKIMNDWEHADLWWDNTKDDKKGTEDFAEKWSSLKD